MQHRVKSSEGCETGAPRRLIQNDERRGLEVGVVERPPLSTADLFGGKGGGEKGLLGGVITSCRHSCGMRPF
jgi:hypothetical protein